MDTKRLADELASRCVALVILDQPARERRPGWPGLGAETREVAAQARAGGVDPALIAARVLAELHDRHEPAMARRLHREFLARFSNDLTLDLIIA
jgi:hypothetical protein